MKISELPVASVQEIANDGTIIVNDIITNAETGEESILTKQISLKEAIQGIGGGSGAGTSYTAGQNITIENGVISANDTTYTAGNNISIENNTISADLTDYARKQDLVAAVKYKGTVASYANLPFSGQEVGDMYNITNADTTHQIKAGDNVVWTGTEWDNYGGTVDLSGKQDILTAGTGIEINNNVVSATGMVGASTAVAGTAGIVPAPAITDKDKFLKGDGTWTEIPTNNGNDYIAGEGIQISNNTISLIPPVYNGASYLYAADGSVSWNLIGNIFNAGTGIYISDGTISIDLNAGDGISIKDNTISVASNTSLELPNFQPSSDYHKVLTVIGNDIDWVSLDDNNSNRLIPYHYDSDAGKVLTIDYQGEAIWDTVSILPDYSDHSFELLAVNSTGELVWTHLGDLYKTGDGAPGDEGAILVASASGQLPHWEFLIPQHDERDAGKVLTVQDDGTLAWELPSSN